MKLFGESPADEAATPRRFPVLDSSPAPKNNAPMPGNWEALFSGPSLAGVPVTEETVMRIAAVYACVSLIGGSIASMPLHIYERTDDGRKKVKNHDLWWLFNEEPNPKTTSATFWEYTTASKLLHGDSLAKIVRASAYSPKIIGFEQLHPRQVEITDVDGRLRYAITRDKGKVEVLDQDDMFHVPGPGFNGTRGLSTIRHALQESGGISLAAGEYSAAFFKNGARADFAITTKGDLTPENAEIMRQTWADRHKGAGNAHKPAVLTGGAEIEQLTINAEDAQLLETRGFQIEEVCRLFGVPPFLVGHNEKTSSWGTGIEQLVLAYIKFTLLKHLVKIQQELNRKCFKTSRLFCEFNTAGLERGDLKGRYEAYRIGLGRAGEEPFLSIDEVRALENREPMKKDNTPNKGNS